MEMEITVPEEVSVMTLPGAVFFPQALMPLHIFEPRYRRMLRDALASNRLFAVAGLNAAAGSDPLQFEPPHRIATLGMVRACQGSEAGNSNLLLQGICRVEVVRIIQEEPYRRIQIRALASESGASAEANQALRREVARLINLRQKLSGAVAGEMTAFLKTIEDPEAFVDMAAFSLCEDGVLKQRLLETLDVHCRLKLFGSGLRREIQSIKLRQKLQGCLPDGRIEEN